MSLIESSFEQLASTQESANHQMGPRFVPARSIPVPSTVSPLLQSAIAAPYRVPAWNADPVDMTGWKALINDLGAQTTTSAFHPVISTGDRKSTRLNSSHQIISYAVFC